MAQYTDMESRINKEIDKKTKCISKIRKKVSKQSKVIKQMKGIFLSAAIEKGAIPIGTSFSKMMKMIAKNRNKCLLGLLDKKQ